MNKIKLLEEWKAAIEASDKVMDALDKVVGPNDGPLRHSVWTMQAAYTRAISLIVGDEGEWLEWFACENDMGEKGLSARAAAGKPMRKIKTLKQLLAVIEGIK